MGLQSCIGTVNWFSSKGQSFGFIDYQDDRGDWLQVYVHYKSIGTLNLRRENLRNGRWYRDVHKGDVVSFEIAPGFGVEGTQAINVEIIKHGE